MCRRCAGGVLGSDSVPSSSFEKSYDLPWLFHCSALLPCPLQVFSSFDIPFLNKSLFEPKLMTCAVSMISNTPHFYALNTSFTSMSRVGLAQPGSTLSADKLSPLGRQPRSSSASLTFGLGSSGVSLGAHPSLPRQSGLF